MKWFLILLLPILVITGCTNKKSLFNQQETRIENTRQDNKNNFSGNISQTIPVNREIVITIGSNVSGNVNIVIPKDETQTLDIQEDVETVEKKEGTIDQKAVIKEEKSSYNPFTLLLIGSGILLLIICFIIIRNIWNNSALGQSLNGAARALGSVSSFIINRRKDNLDPIRDQIYKEVEEDIKQKMLDLERKKNGKG